MSEAKSVGQLIDQARQLDSDIIERITEVQYGSYQFDTKERLLTAREKLTGVINELLKARR